MSSISANWIWYNAPSSTDVFCRARRCFDLNETCSTVSLTITCSGHYVLWINNRFVARGPMRSSNHRKRFDRIDISQFLQKGENVIGVQLIHYGYQTACCPLSPGGFLCEIDFGNRKIISDDQWLMKTDTCYSTKSQRRNENYGPIEIYNACDEDDWLKAEYDDSDWERALILNGKNGPGPHVEPWLSLVERSIPMLRETSITSERVVRVAEIRAQEDMFGSGHIPSLASRLLIDVPIETEFTRIENPENALSDTGAPAVVYQPSYLDRSTPDQRHATVIFDFGREIAGYGWIDVEGEAGAVVDIAYGERLIAGRVQAVVQNTGYADRYILKKGRQRHTVYDWKGFRYLQLTFRKLTKPLKLYAVGALLTEYPFSDRGRLKTSNAMVNSIWEAGAYTQRLCTHDSVMDTPWREQAQWLGDGRLQLLVIQNAFGDKAMPRTFVENFADQQFDNGQMPMTVPSVRNFINDYSLWWIVAVKDVLLFDGDIEFSRRVFPHIVKLLDYFSHYLNDDDILENVPGWTFIDWADIGKTGACAALNAIYAIALDAACFIADSTGYLNTTDEGDEKKIANSTVSEWVRSYKRISDAYHDTFWDNERRLYVDNIIDEKQSGRFCIHTQALAVLAGLTKIDNGELLVRAMADKSLVPPEPFFAYYVLEALAEARLESQAFTLLMKWSSMIDDGSSSFWEEWQVYGTYRGGSWLMRPRSHAHAWSSGPTPWLSQHLLGVQVHSLNNTVTIAPLTCGLKKAEGTVPTRFGDVVVSWEVGPSEFNITVEVPESINIDFIEPPEYEKASVLNVVRR